MSEHCNPDQRARLEQAADELLTADTRVVGVDTLPPDTGTRARWTLHATVEGDCVPPAVLRELVLADADLLDVTPQGPDHVTLLARA